MAMSGQLPSKMLVSALLRGVEQAGGFGVLLSRGEDSRGGILVQMAENGNYRGFVERMLDFDGNAQLVPCGPPSDAPASPDESPESYIHRRRRSDPDLWILELDVVQAKRFIAEMIAIN